MRPARTLRTLACVAACCLAWAATADAESTWRLEQPSPPLGPTGQSAPPVALGQIGAISFWAPNRGVLITAGDPPTIPAGVWAYNGRGWHELSNQCGATDGRIAWAGAEEFWTVSDGRPGEAEVNGEKPPLEDDTLCRFAGGRIVESFAAPAFESDSYQAMHAAACLGPEDCWFAGSRVGRGSSQVGSFHLHWNGTVMTEVPYTGEEFPVEDMTPFDGQLYESVRLSQAENEKSETQRSSPPVLHVFEPSMEGFQPLLNLSHEVLYGPGEQPWGLDYLHLAAGPGALWAAAGQQPRAQPSQGPRVLRFDPTNEEWTQLLGPGTSPTGTEKLGKGATIQAIAAEPNAGAEAVWLGLPSEAQVLEQQIGGAARARARVARVAPDGEVPRVEELPSGSEASLGPLGTAYKITCPAAEDCWMATFNGWLFHLAPADERTLPEDTDPNFGGLITERPADKGLPQTPPDTLPPDTSGLPGEAQILAPVETPTKKSTEFRVPVALISHLHSRIVNGTTLELRFHLAVKARLRLVAKRRKRVVAQTPMYTLKAGSRSLRLRLSRQRWPTELHIVEHPLAPLPTESGATSNEDNNVVTGLAFPAGLAANGFGLP